MRTHEWQATPCKIQSSGWLGTCNLCTPVLMNCSITCIAICAKIYTAHFCTEITSIHYSFIFINNYFLCQSLCFTVVQLWFLGYGTTSLGDKHLIFLRRFSGLIWRAKCQLLHPHLTLEDETIMLSQTSRYQSPSTIYQKNTNINILCLNKL
jgi:hypothetical protein